MDEYRIFTSDFFIRLLINTAAMVLLVRVIYYTTYQKRELFFTFFLLNFIVFLLAFMLEKARVFDSLSTAFGLLAAFSLLRFRTETISTKDMTYLFIVMALGLVNSVTKVSIIEVLGINSMVILFVFAVDSVRLIRSQKIKTVEYDSLENIRPDRNAELIADLRQRTGLDIQKTSIEQIDFGKQRVVIKIYYF